MAASRPLRLRPPRHHVDHRAVGWWHARAALLALPPVLVLGLLAWLIEPARFWLALPAGLLTVPGLAYLVIMPRWRYRVHRWETTGVAVYTRGGWFWEQSRIAPLARIQTVDTVRGPLERLFGLATVTVTTASARGALTIAGLDHRLAEEIAERLTEQAQAAENTTGDAT
ncbi:hypothetical protein FHR81_005305 [Actinoalloteichus hoggarensis]|uniref:Bacterial membrane flanked domain protein n=1 Tax=Actinoalloteichus hoggarensis TaxID=1470176 RepID=A0A221WAU4_9PSEU|nr:PH domain-containing protein [Actinoalloteichus hoggarensis]ASO22629.1 Bacterial membrane flanked domain protein [Actinoalloteichus hoggarensis]MBB5924228.1 hypothetical protein [Actinoalloteichus hoggarensis]